MPTICYIDFDNNPAKVVYSGQLLKGSVRLTLSSEKSVRGIYIKIVGEAYAHWTEGSGDSRKSYTGKEDYLDERTYFVGGTEGEVRVQPGTYYYTFQCLLPPLLPTSFEGDFGHIRYTAHVVLDIPMWPDKEFSDPFTVIKAINLNEDPALREPVIAEKNKTFYLCCLLCCCESNPLTIVGRIPVGGYTPGQTINLEFIVTNKSDQSVYGFTAQLIKQITYHIYANSDRQKMETIIITEKDTRGCAENQSDVINVNLQVPSIPPTDCTTSNIVKVRYFVRIIGSVDCCHSNPVLPIPIIIGSYPIADITPYPVAQPITTIPMLPTNGVITQQPSAPENIVNNGAPLLPNADFPSAPFPFPNDEPPTYEEAIKFGNNSERAFVPKYPMFKRTTSYSSGN